MTLASIVIPAYNSQETIYQLVEDVIQIFKDCDIEFVIVNDCSTDNTQKNV